MSEGWTATCGDCGHEDSVLAFTRTEISGDLPGGRIQCPECRRAWQRRAVGEWQTVEAENGNVMSYPEGGYELRAVPAVL